MGILGRFPVLLICALTAMLAIDEPALVSGADAPIDNVAVEWNYVACLIICAQPISTGPVIEPNIILAQLHLAQWHALIALKNTGTCTTQEVVVAYASHKILSTYFPLTQVGKTDPLLRTQLKKLRVSETEQKLGKQLGEAVALDFIGKQVPAREFALQALENALDSGASAPRAGDYRYLNNTPAGRDSATFIYYGSPIAQPYVIPEPSVYIKAFLPELKPPKVPSDEWDEEYAKVVNLGRAGPARTREMNDTAHESGCLKVNGAGTAPLVACFSDETWAAAARATLPRGTSLYDTVVLFAKLHVAMHDTLVVFSTLQYGFRFWRPEMAFKAGDPRHKPIPNWTPYIHTPNHAEYPSASVSHFSAAATILENFIGKSVPFTLPDGGVWGPGCPAQGPYHGLSFHSFRAFVRFMQKSRVVAGAHFNKSVLDGEKVGNSVASYVEANWGVGTPSGVLPNPTYLKVFAELPRVQTSFSPIKLVY